MGWKKGTMPPEVRAQIAKALRGRKHPKHSARMKRLWRDGTYASLLGRKVPRHSERMKELWQDAAYASHQSKAHRGQVPQVKPEQRARGARHPRWKGGTFRSDGYKLVMVDGKQVREHRHVMEQHLGRKLKRHEIVHHKNGKRADNRIENLEVIRSQSQHNKKLARHRCPWCGSITTRKPEKWPRQQG